MYFISIILILTAIVNVYVQKDINTSQMGLYAVALAAGIMGLAVSLCYRNSLFIYDHGLVKRSGFIYSGIRNVNLAWSDLTSLEKYNSIKRGSYFYFGLKPKAPVKQFKYPITDTFRNKEDIEGFLRFMNSKGIEIRCIQQADLAAVFDEEKIKRREGTGVASLLSHFYVEGLSK